MTLRHVPTLQVGLDNHVSKMEGAQVSAVDNHGDGVKGLQAASVMNEAILMSGLQLAGLANSATQINKGLQIGFYNQAGKDGWLGTSQGIQAGGINIASQLKGFQAGIVNYAKEIGGVQVGAYCHGGHGNYLQVGLLTQRSDGPRWSRFTPLIGFHRESRK